MEELSLNRKKILRLVGNIQSELNNTLLDGAIFVLNFRMGTKHGTKPIKNGRHETRFASKKGTEHRKQTPNIPTPNPNSNP